MDKLIMLDVALLVNSKSCLELARRLRELVYDISAMDGDLQGVALAEALSEIGQVALASCRGAWDTSLHYVANRLEADLIHMPAAVLLPQRCAHIRPVRRMPFGQGQFILPGLPGVVSDMRKEAPCNTVL